MLIDLQAVYVRMNLIYLIYICPNLTTVGKILNIFSYIYLFPRNNEKSVGFSFLKTKKGLLAVEVSKSPY